MIRPSRMWMVAGSGFIFKLVMQNVLREFHNKYRICKKVFFFANFEWRLHCDFQISSLHMKAPKVLIKYNFSSKFSDTSVNIKKITNFNIFEQYCSKITLLTLSILIKRLYLQNFLLNSYEFFHWNLFQYLQLKSFNMGISQCILFLQIINIYLFDFI